MKLGHLFDTEVDTDWLTSTLYQHNSVYLYMIHSFILSFKAIYQGCGLGLDASVSRPSRGAEVPRLGLASELVRLDLVSVSSSECLKALVSVSPRLELQRLGLLLGLGLQRLRLASVSTKKLSCTSVQFTEVIQS